jgi:hypothetical protein
MLPVLGLLRLDQVVDLILEGLFLLVPLELISLTLQGEQLDLHLKLARGGAPGRRV